METMRLLSQKVEVCDLRPGDHIYTWRAAYTYSHHGIYIGDDLVVHFTRSHDSTPPDPLSKWISSSMPSHPTVCLGVPSCSSRENTSGVIISCLNCFLDNGHLYRFEYGVNPIYFIAKVRGGTCTIGKSDPPALVIHRANYLLFIGFGNYDLFTSNCEGFALYCKTGLLIRDLTGSGQAVSGVSVLFSRLIRGLTGSGQAVSGIAVPLSVITSLPVTIYRSSFAGFVSNAAIYSGKRYFWDIGVRKDAVKVEVEDIASFFGKR